MELRSHLEQRLDPLHGIVADLFPFLPDLHNLNRAERYYRGFLRLKATISVDLAQFLRIFRSELLSSSAIRFSDLSRPHCLRDAIWVLILRLKLDSESERISFLPPRDSKSASADRFHRNKPLMERLLSSLQNSGSY